MRTFKLISGLVLVLAFSAVAVATASAAETLWVWLPGAAGTKFGGKSGKAVLQVSPAGGGASITCTSSEILLETSKLTSPATDATLAEADVHFKGCTSAGLPVESLGDTSGIILTHILIHNCVIKSEDFGLLIKPEPVHIEIIATGLLLVVEGSFVALISPKGKKQLGPFALTAEQKEGKQAIEKCEGGVAESLKTSIDGSEFFQSGEEVKEGSLTFDTVEQTAELA